MTLRMSSAERYYLCPGAPTAEQKIRQLRGSEGEESSSAVAQMGQDCHTAVGLVLAGETPETCGDYQDMWVQKFANYVHGVESTHEGPKVSMSERDIYIWHDGKPMWVGHSDRITLCNDWSVHIFDYKFGYIAPLKAYQHVQLRAYVVGVVKLLEMFYPMEKITGLTAYILSAAPGHDERFSQAVFTYSEVELAEAEMIHIGERTMVEDAKRNPGPSQCKYCPAGGTEVCPESTAALQVHIPKTELMPPEHMAELYTLYKKQVEPMAKKLTERIREILEAGTEVEGVRLGKAQQVREVKDASAAYALLADILTPEQFTECCKLSIGKTGLEKVVRDVTGTTWKAAADVVMDRLAELVLTSDKARSIIIEE